METVREKRSIHLFTAIAGAPPTGLLMWVAETQAPAQHWLPAALWQHEAAVAVEELGPNPSSDLGCALREHTRQPP